MFSYKYYWSTPIDIYHATWTVSPQLSNHPVGPAPTVQQADTDDSGYILPQLALRVGV